jgi:hypothetical protein
MSEKIYGVEKDTEYGPKEVLLAVENCFTDAHKEVLDATMFENASEQDKEALGRLNVHYLVKNTIEKGGGSYDNPTKADLLNLIEQLRVFAQNFRKPEIVEKRYAEIKGLIDFLK